MVAVLHVHVGIHHHVVVVVLGQGLVDAVPCAQVGPTEVATHHAHVVELVEHACLDGYIGIGGETLRHVGRLLLKRGVWVLLVESGEHGGQELGKHLLDGLGIGGEDAGVPQELAAVHEHLGKLAIGLLGEAPHVEDVCLHRLVGLYVTIARLWPGGFHSHRHEGVVRGHEAHCRLYVLAESVVVEYELVAGHHYQHRVLVVLCHMVACPRHAGRGVAQYRLHKDVLAWQLGQLLPHDVKILGVCAEQDMVG